MLGHAAQAAWLSFRVGLLCSTCSTVRWRSLGKTPFRSSSAFLRLCVQEAWVLEGKSIAFEKWGLSRTAVESRSFFKPLAAMHLQRTVFRCDRRPSLCPYPQTAHALVFLGAQIMIDAPRERKEAARQGNPKHGKRKKGLAAHVYGANVC